MVTDQALERKKRRAEIKEEAGNIRKLRRSLLTREWRVWFDHDGNIITFTQSDLEPKENWNTHDFTQDQLQILVGKDTGRYVVVKDKEIDNLYSIQVRTDNFYKLDKNSFLAEIKDFEKETDYYAVLCTLSKDCFNVALNTDIKAEYTNIKPKDAIKEGSRNLVFYLTAWKDPHIFLEEISVSLEDLLINNSVDVKISGTPDQFSVYTKKLFQEYKLIRKAK
jgi:hypothetical protein